MTTLTAEKYQTRGANLAGTETPQMELDQWVIPDFTSDTDIEMGSAKSGGSDMRCSNQAEVLTLPKPVNNSLHPVTLPDYRVRLLQQWECVVIKVSKDFVTCEMHDLTDESQPEEFAEVYLSEFSLFDIPLLHQGAVFYWSVGQEVKKTGTIRKYSEVRVRRMPPLSRAKQRELQRRVEHLSRRLDLNNG